MPTSSAKRIERITVSLVGRPMAVQVTAFDSVTGSTEIQEESGLYFLYTDHLGSVTAVTDVTGARIGDVTRFLPFGEYRGTEPTADHVTDQGFTGHKENREIGLTYMNARFYVPEIGQFASADTIVPDPMNPQSFNRYAYGYNNPVKYFDPDGHCPSPVNNGYEGEATSIICVAFFIPTAESEVFPPPNFIGDDRDFSSDSDISASRAWVWIDTDTGDILDQYIHPTCNTLGQCAGPLNETGLYQNSIETELDENGNIHLDYNIRCAGLRCGVAPGPNGEITFSKRDDGSFTSQGDINEFPNVEAYFYDDLQEQPTTLFRHRFVSQDDVEAGLTPFITSFSGMLGINQFSWDYRNNQRIGGH